MITRFLSLTLLTSLMGAPSRVVGQAPVAKSAEPPRAVLFRTPAQAIALSPDGKRIAIGALEASPITIWDRQGRRVGKLADAEAGSSAHFVGFSEDGRVIESRHFADNSKDWSVVRLWNLETGKPTFRQLLPVAPAPVFSADRKILSYAEEDGTVISWNLRTDKKARHQTKNRQLQSLVYSVRGELWALTQPCAERPRSEVVNVADGKIVLEGAGSLRWDVSRDGAYTAGWIGLGPCLGGALVLGDIKAKKATPLVAGQLGLLGPPVFSKQGKKLGVAWSPTEPEALAQVWDVATGRSLVKIVLPGGVQALAFSNDGHDLAVAGAKFSLLLPKVWAEPKHAPLAIALSPDGKWLAVGNAAGKLRFLPMDKSAPARDFNMPGHAIRMLAFSPDSAHLAIGTSTGRVRLWDVHKEAVRHDLRIRGLEILPLDVPAEKQPLVERIYQPEILLLSFAEDGRTLSAHSSGGQRHWHVVTGEEIK